MAHHDIIEFPTWVSNLPKKVRELYQTAYSEAWKQYNEANTDVASREETATQAAWMAVRKKYEKRNDRWFRKDLRI